MSKRLSELIFLLFICGIFSALIIVSYVADKPIWTYVKFVGFGHVILPVMASLLFVSVAASCGYVFGVSRGKGRMIEAEDLIPDKPFKIVKTEILNGNMTTLVTIEIGGRRRLCLCLSSVPSSATHLKVFLDDIGASRFEFVKITPEVIEVL